MALFRDLQSAVRADLGSDLDEDALLREIARRALGGPDDAGRASYQIALSRCDECGRSSIEAGGESFSADAVTVEMAACDSQHLPPPTDPGRPHVGAPRPKATQTVSPRLRRDVLRRDGNRCVLPGCRSHRYLDVHHVDPRCEGGSNDPERLAALCGQHHHAVHSGALVIEGTAAGGFVFRHGDGTPYGGEIQPSIVEHASQAQAALQRMGFTSKQARERIDKALRQEAPSSFIELVRAALRASEPIESTRPGADLCHQAGVTKSASAVPRLLSSSLSALSSKSSRRRRAAGQCGKPEGFSKRRWGTGATPPPGALDDRHVTRRGCPRSHRRGTVHGLWFGAEEDDGSRSGSGGAKGPLGGGLWTVPHLWRWWTTGADSGTDHPTHSAAPVAHHHHRCLENPSGFPHCPQPRGRRFCFCISEREDLLQGVRASALARALH